MLFRSAKGLIHLLFPLNWQFHKGIAYDLELLYSPIPYCFGVLKTSFKNKSLILNGLNDNDMSFIILDIDKDYNPILDIEPKEFLVYPNYNRLVKQLELCCSKNDIKINMNIDQNDNYYEDFIKDIQEIFLNEISQLLDGFDYALKKDKRNDINSFRTEFINFMHKGKRTPQLKNEIKFAEQMIKTQAFAFLRDEAVHENQGNYARIKAMQIRGSSPPIELLRINLYSTSTIVLNRLFRLVEAKKKIKESEESKQNSEISLKSKFDWIKEIMRMKTTPTIIEKPDESHASIGPYSVGPNLSVVSDKICKICKNDNNIVMNIEEYNPYVESFLPSNDNNDDKITTIKIEEKKEKKKKKGQIHFYGPKGVLAFLNEFMRYDTDTLWKNSIIEEERNILEYFNSSTNTTTSSAVNEGVPVYTTLVESEDILDSVSDPTGSLDGKDSNKCNSVILRETPFLSFSNTKGLQFLLFLGIFWYKYDPVAIHAVNIFLKAFSYVQSSATYRSYFPINFFKIMIAKLTLGEFKNLIKAPSELEPLIKNEYKKKIDEISFNPIMASMSVMLPNAPSLLLKEDSFYTSEESKSYLNDGEDTIKIINHNPNIIMSCLLLDMISLLNINKSKGKKMFSITLKSNFFPHVEKQANILKVSFILM